MNYNKPILTGILLSATLALGANDLFGQTLPGPNVPTPKRDLPQPTDPTIPGKPAPWVPSSQPIPGQRGTIPEQMEPPEFQKANDLPATGVLDKKTADKLGITLKGDKDLTPQKPDDGTKRESKDSTKREQQ